MPSLEHEIVVNIINSSPELILDLLRRVLPQEIPPYATISQGNPIVQRIVPSEYRSDAVLELRAQDGKLIAELIFEVQISIDKRKLQIWPIYLVSGRAEHEAYVLLVILTWDEDVAAWARTPIDLGFGQGILRFVVIGPGVIPKIRDEEQAYQNPPLAVLSALSHARDEKEGTQIALAAFAALTRLLPEQVDSEIVQAYMLIIWRTLEPVAQKILETKLMEIGSLKNVPLIPFFQRIADKIEAEALEKGRAEGRAEGAANALHEVLLDVIEQRHIVLSEDERVEIETCQDTAVLYRWMHNAVTASTAHELFSKDAKGSP